AGPAMDLQVHLHTLYLRDSVRTLLRLFRIGKTASIPCAAPHNCFMGLAAVIDSDAFGSQHSRRVTGRFVELERLTTQAQRIAFLHDHVPLRHSRRRCTTSTRTAARLLDHLPVFFNGDNSPTRDFLNLGCTTEMVEMSVTQNNVFDGF